MKPQVYLGVDLGAESGRVMAGLWDGRQMRLEELHRFSNGGVDIAGSLRWDVLRLWSEIQNGLAVAGRKYGSSIRSVGVDTWGVDYCLLSRGDELLGQPFHYRDQRTNGVLQRAFRKMPRAEIFRSTGLQFMGINTLYQLWAHQRDHPEVLHAAKTLLMMPDFFHWCLSGVRAAEFTEATTTQFFSPKRHNWSYSVLKRFDLPTSILPPVVTPGTNLGPLRTTLGSATGLGAARVVVPASHDTGSAVAAVPTSLSTPGSWAYISSGTWSLMGVELPHANLSKQVLDFNLTNEGGVDGTYRLLKNITGLWIVQQCKRAFEKQGRVWDYARLASLARNAPSLRSFIDPDDPRFGSPVDMPSAMREYCRETLQPIPASEGSLIRCALESLALKYQQVLCNLEAVTGRKIEVIHVVGGGSRNATLNQFTANACQRPIAAGPVEATVMGNLLVQARSAGELSSLSEIRKVVRSSAPIRLYRPGRTDLAEWAQARERFRALTGT